MWWQSPVQRAEVIRKCVDPATPQESAGVVAMALHGVGRDRLVELSKSGAVEVDDIVPAVAGADVAPLVEALSGLMPVEAAVRVVGELSYDAAAGARLVARQLVSKGVPVPVAVERAAAVFGPGAGDCAQFVEKMSGPVAPHVVTDTGLRAVQVWAEAWADGFEPVAKDEFIRRGRRVVQARDSDGEFASDQAPPEQKSRVAAAEERQVSEKDRIAALREKNRALAGKRREMRDMRQKRQVHRDRRAERERVAEAKRQEELERQKTGRKSLTGLAAEARVSVKETAEAKATVERKARLAAQAERYQLRQKRQVHREKLAYRKESLEQAQKVALQRMLATPMSSDGGVDWDPEPMPQAGVDALVREHGFDTLESNPRLYIQVPLDVVHRAFKATVGRDSFCGPRISVQAANQYLEDTQREPLRVRRLDSNRRSINFSEMERQAGIFYQEDGADVLLIPKSLIGVDERGEPVMNIHVPSAWTSGWVDRGWGEYSADVAPFQSIMAGRPFSAMSSVDQFMTSMGLIDKNADRGDPDVWKEAIPEADHLKDLHTEVASEAERRIEDFAAELTRHYQMMSRVLNQREDEVDPAEVGEEMVRLGQMKEDIIKDMRSGSNLDVDVPDGLVNQYENVRMYVGMAALLREHPWTVTPKTGLPDEQVMDYLMSDDYPFLDDSDANGMITHDSGGRGQYMTDEAHLIRLGEDDDDIGEDEWYVDDPGEYRGE